MVVTLKYVKLRFLPLLKQGKKISEMVRELQEKGDLKNCCE